MGEAQAGVAIGDIALLDSAAFHAGQGAGSQRERQPDSNARPVYVRLHVQFDSASKSSDARESGAVELRAG
jgi:hypothetical protein